MPRSKVSNTSKLILLLPPLLAGLRRVGATALVDLCKCLPNNKPEPQIIIQQSSRINQERKPTTLRRRRKPHAYWAAQNSAVKFTQPRLQNSAPHCLR